MAIKKRRYRYFKLLLQMRDEMDLLGGAGVIAKRSGLSRTYVNRALSAKGNPRYRNFFKLVTALELQDRIFFAPIKHVESCPLFLTKVFRSQKDCTCPDRKD